MSSDLKPYYVQMALESDMKSIWASNRLISFGSIITSAMGNRFGYPLCGEIILFYYGSFSSLNMSLNKLSDESRKVDFYLY